MWSRKSSQWVGAGSCDRREGAGVTGGGCYGSHREADTGFGDVDRQQADDEGQGGDDLEVDERLDAHAADAFEVAVTGDADDEGGEDERGDDGLDQAQKDVGEDAGLGGDGGGIEA